MDLADLGIRIDAQELEAAIRALDKFQRESDDASRSADKLEKSGKRMNLALAGIAGTVAGMAAATLGLGSVVSTLATFDRSMDSVQAVTRATTSEMDRMRAVAKGLGASTEFSAAQAADGLRFLGMAGFSAAEAMDSIPAVLDLATASGMGLAEAADIASNIMSGFGIAAEEAASVADVLAAASSRANTDVSQLGSAMSYVAPAAAALSISIEDTAAAIGVLSDAGIQGTRAGTGLRTILAQLSNPTDDAAAAADALGVSIRDLNPQANSLTDIISTLKDANLDFASAAKLAGTEGASSLLALVDQSDHLKDLGKELTAVDGAASDMATTMRDNLRGDLDGLVSAVQGLIISMGDAGLTDVLRGVVRLATDTVRAFAMLADAAGSVVRWIGQIADDHREADRAFRSANDAITAEIDALEELNGFLSSGKTVSLEVAQAKLDEALARRSNIQAMIEERMEAVKQTSEYDALALEIDRLNALIQVSAGQTAYNDMGNEVSATNKLVGELYETQTKIDDLLKGAVELTAEQRAEVDRLNAKMAEIKTQIDNATDGVVHLRTETGNAASEMDRVTSAANTAAGAAGSLAVQLSYAAQYAAQVSANLANAPIALRGLQDEAAVIQAGLDGIAAGYDSIGVSSAQYRKELEIQYGLADAGSAAETAYLNAVINRETAQYEANQRNRKSLTDQLVALNKVTTATGGGGGGGGGGLSEAQKTLNDMMEEGVRITERMRTPMEEYADTAAHLEDLLAAGAISQETFNRAIEDAQSKITTTNDFVEGFASTVVDSMFSMSESSKSALDEIWDYFKQTLINMLKAAATNQITLSFGAAVNPVGAVTQAATGGGIGGIAGSLIGSTNGLGIIGGATGLIQNTLANGIGGAFGYIKTALSGATASIGGFGAAIGALALPLAGVGLIMSGLREKTEVTGQGFEVTARGMDVAIQEFEKVKKSRFWGLSSSESETYRAAGSDADPIREAVAGVQESILTASDALGIARSAFDDFSKTVRIDLHNRDESERAEEFANEIKKLSNAMASAALAAAASSETAAQAAQAGVGVWELLAREGEKATDVLTRLANDLTTVNGVFRYMHATLLDVSIAGGEAASALVALFGTADDFTGAVTNYLSKFYSESEQLAFVTKDATRQLRDLGIAMPKTREQYRAMVEAMDLTTERGRESYAALISLADAMDQVLPSANALSDALVAAFQTGASAVSEAITAVGAAISASEAAAKAWRDAAKSLRDFVLEVRSTTDDPFRNAAVLKTAYEDALAKAKTGDVAAIKDFQDIAKKYLTAADASTTDQGDFNAIRGSILADSKLVAGIAELSAAQEDVVTTLLREQNTILEDMAAFLEYAASLTPEEIAALNGTLGDALRDIDGTLATFDGALSQVSQAIDDVRSMSYDALVKQIDVIVSGKAGADLPAYLQKLIVNSATGIQTSVDFLLRRDDIPDDLKWMAVRGDWAAVQTIVYAANTAGLSNELRKLAVLDASRLLKTIDFTVGSQLSDQVKRLALNSAHDLLVTVRAVLASDTSNAVKRIALGNVGLYTVAIDAALEPGVDKQLRKLILSGTQTYVASIIAAVDTSGLSDRARKMILLDGTTHALTIVAALEANMADWKRRLLVNASTSALRAITVAVAFKDALTAEQRQALMQGNATIRKTIDGAVNLPTIDWNTPEGRLLWARPETVRKAIAGNISMPAISWNTAAGRLLWARPETVRKTISGDVGLSDIMAIAEKRKLLLETGGTITKIIKGVINTGTLTQEQLGLLNAVSGAANGKLTFAGGLTMDLSAPFKSELVTNIKDPIEAVGDAIAAMQSALSDDLKKLRDQASNQEKIAKAQDRVSLLSTRQEGVTSEVTQAIEQFYAMAKEYGVQLQNASGGQAAIYVDKEGRVQSDYAKISGASSDIAKFKADNDSLESLIYGGNWQISRNLADKIAEARKQVYDLGGIPQFAEGGVHTGGLAIVGEEGPELVDMAPSRVTSNSDTNALFASLGMKLQAILDHLEEADPEIIDLLTLIKVSSQKTERGIVRFEKVGMKISET